MTDPALAAELWPAGARVIRQDRGIFDTFSLSLISLQSIARLSELRARRLTVERFRPNILVDAAGGADFPEDDWVGQVLHIGGLRLRVDKRDGRCAVITVDPATGDRDPAVLRTVLGDRQGCLGVYGSTVTPGSIAIDDAVLLAHPPT